MASIQYLKSCAINEQVYISCLLNNSDLLDSEVKNFCINQISIDIFDTLKKLREQNISFTTQTIASETLKVNSDVSVDLIKSLKELVEYNKEDFLFYKKRVIESHVKDVVQSKILKKVSTDLLSKGELDLDSIEEIIDELNWAVDTVKDTNKNLKTFNVLLNSYEEELTNRGNHNNFISSGNFYLDSHLVGGGIPKGQFITLFAGPGMGKSSYLLNLITGNINKKTPLLYMPLEMGSNLSLDKLLSLKTQIPLNEFYAIDQGTGQLPDYVLEEFYKEKARLIKNQNFRMVDSASVSLSNVHSYIKDMKKETRADSLLIAIDLFTMLTEGRGDNKASSYQDMCDGFFEILKEENSSGIVVVQSRRKDNITVNTYEDCRKYMPAIEEIKGSQSFEERSRVIISIFRQKHVGLRMLGEEDPEVMISSDILEANIIKQNLGSLATLKYLYQGDIGKVWRYEEND